MDMSVEREFEMTAGDETTKLGLTPQGWPPEPMVVKNVDEGTWAAENGAQIGDKIIRINGVDVQEKDKKGIIQCFKERPVSIVFSREVPSFTAEEGDTRLGMQPGNWPPGLVHVRHVEPDSWADRMGIDPGSAIMAVNGKRTENMQMLDFRTMLRDRPVTLSIAAPGELSAAQDPAEMTRGLRFSLVPGSPMSPMESPMLQRLKAVEEQAAGEAAGSEEEDNEVQQNLVEEQLAQRIIEDNKKAEQAAEKKKLEEVKAKEIKQSAPAQRKAPNGGLPTLTKQSTLSLNGHAMSSSQRPSTTMVGSPTMEHAPVNNDVKEFSILRYKGVVPTYMECWLEKRGPTDTYKWMKRWFVFYEDRVEYFKDVERKEAKGDVRIKPYSRIVAFREKELPGDAVKYKSNKPFGFVLDPDPSAGKQRRMHYFDAGSEEVLRSVLSNFQKACEGHEARIKEVSKFILKSVYIKAPSFQAQQASLS